MKNFRCQISYDGTRYTGFRSTKTSRSVEEAIQFALENILNHPISIQGASRTDQGVHAKGQVINFFSAKEMHPSKLVHALRGSLPSDIAVTAIEIAPYEFHPSLDALAKLYTYSVCNSDVQLPFHRLYSWHFPVPALNLEAMEKAALALLGTHDFSAFSTEVYDNPTCRIDSIAFESIETNRYHIHIKGSRFLYHMVRTIVGTLVYVGAARLDPLSLPEILNGKDRKRAGVTAPAHGLCLSRVFY